MAYELKTGGVLLHPIFGGGKEKDKYVYLAASHYRVCFYGAINICLGCVVRRKAKG